MKKIAVIALVLAALCLGTVSTGLRLASASTLVISIPNVQSGPGSTVAIPINVSDAAGIAGGNFTVAFDSSILTAMDVTKTSLTDDFVLTKNLSNPGEARIALASATAISDASHAGGALVTVTFAVSESAVSGATSPLTFTQAAAKDVDGTTISSTTQSGMFTVQPQVPSLTLTSPNGSESSVPGSVQSLTWTVTGDTSAIHHFSLYYTVDGGNSWERVLTAAGAVVYGAPGDRSYAWTVPDRFSSHAKVIVYAMNATSSMLAYDASDAFFTMAPAGAGTLPAISLVHPSGDTWTAGTTQTISWSVSGSLPVSFHHFSIYASLEDGRNGSWFNVGFSAIPSLSWVIPAGIGSAHARIVVYAMDATSHLLSDALPASFVISPATGAYGITVTAPAGGATLHVGAITSVTWTTSGTVPPQVSSYKVWYSVDGGLSWEPAGTSAASPFSWTVPARISPSCSVRVVALDASSNVLGVATSATFTIAP